MALEPLLVAARHGGRGELNRKEEALWLFQRLAPHSAVDNLAFAISTSAEIDPGRLARAASELARRHPVLRTVFPAEQGMPVRRMLAAGTPPPVVNLEVSAEKLDATLTALAREPFDLLTQAPFRLARVAVPGERTVLCLVAHHIAFDARSAGVALPELATIYTELGGQTEPGGPAVTGTDQTAPEPQRRDTPPSPDSLQYWAQRIAGVDPSTQPLGRARPEPPTPTFDAGRLERPMHPASRVALETLRSRLRVTDNMVLLATYLLLLARHGAGPDLVVAVPVDTRGREATSAATRPESHQVGFHVNTLPVRVTVDPAASFRDLATEVRTQLVAGMAHADVSFESLLGDLGLETMSWRAPLFRHMFSFLPASTILAPGPLPDATWHPVDPGLSRYDVQLLVARWPGSIMLQAIYSTEILDAAYAAALLDRFEILLRAAAAHPDRPVAELDMWRPDERSLVDGVNQAALDAPVLAPHHPLPRLVAARMREQPEATALIEPDGQHLDYRWLEARAATLRHHLRPHLRSHPAAGGGDVVALALPRGGELAAAVLATWSLGASYLPLDRTQPPARLQAQLTAAGAAVVLTTGDAIPDGGAGPRVLRCEHLDPVAAAESTPLPDALEQAAADLAYVIFTSGSTGQPKAVEVTHAGLANVVGFFAHHLAVSARDRVLWLTTFSFDISALELFLSLGYGGAAVVAPDAALVQPALLLDLVARHDPAVVQATPTIWRLVASALDSGAGSGVGPAGGGVLAGRTMLCGGEPLSATLAQRLLRCGCRLFNVYGPTETTIWSTVDEVHSGQTDPLGVGGPISGTTLQVVDEAGRALPPGLVGELCIGGVGVARGYRGQPELTAQRFRDDPTYGRHYRSGDLATWRPDGTIELLGRADRQVKLRGRRIELGEIESAFEQHPGVTAAAVVVRGDPQRDGRLVGYLQPRPDAPADLPAQALRFVRTLLPPYLLPAALVVLDALPRNASGKLNYRGLPDVPTESDAGAEDVVGEAVDDPLVVELIKIWSELLDRADLGPHSNFFASGGHSLLAALLAVRVGERTGREVSLQEVVDAPTPAALARVVDGKEQE